MEGGGPADALERAIEGRVVRPGSPDYDEARRTYNGLIDRRPRLIARPTSRDAVAACVRYAREHGISLGVRGGGHSVAGHAIVEDGLVVDLSAMRSVTIDSQARVAHVAGGALWCDLDPAALVHGLGVPGGVFGDTGVAGLTLGGGIGFLMGVGGYSCDNVVGAELVTADGSIIEAAEDPDLLWALRGGGGNFGAVTRLDLALHRVGLMYGGVVDVPLEDGGALRRWSA
ncbi:MAG TPA: FAD-dependent oxidoreductase, partial [Candidatus Binatia bacterium]|nr:FAD-dependent oxidoreductase [Candidatus Binatia bacterium]